MSIDAEKTEPVGELILGHVRSAMPEGIECDLSLETDLHDVGLDSVARMDIVHRIEEELGIRLPETELFELETCADLVACVTRVKYGSAADSSASTGAGNRRNVETPAVDLASISTDTCDVEQFPECVAFDQRLQATAAAGLQNPFFRVSQAVDHARATVEDRDVVNFASFDYLGFSNEPQVAEAAQDAIARFGTSASASRLVGGNSSIVEELDQELADFVGAEAAVVFPSGFGTNASLMGHLFGEGDLILYDELAHNSIVQGAILSAAQRRTFPHNDFEFVDRLLGDIRGRFRRVVVAVEGVYSMDGDYPDLARFIEVKNRHKSLLYVDEAHSLGVLGATGRGLCEHFDVDPSDGDVWMGTISKALASGGGYVAGRASLIQYLKYTTPAIVFSTGISPANAAAALAALRLLQREPKRVAALRERSRQFLELAKAAGLNTGNSQDTPVIPIILGDSMLCMKVSQDLLEQGINALPILYPAVPENASRVRFFITADHTEQQISDAVQCIVDAMTR